MNDYFVIARDTESGKRLYYTGLISSIPWQSDLPSSQVFTNLSDARNCMKTHQLKGLYPAIEKAFIVPVKIRIEIVKEK